MSSSLLSVPCGNKTKATRRPTARMALLIPIPDAPVLARNPCSNRLRHARLTGVGRWPRLRAGKNGGTCSRAGASEGGWLSAFSRLCPYCPGPVVKASPRLDAPAAGLEDSMLPRNARMALGLGTLLVRGYDGGVPRFGCLSGGKWEWE